MNPLAALRSLVSALFQRSGVNRELDEELRSHIQLRTDDLERSGIPRSEAERRARIEFGAYVRFKEESREEMGSLFVETSIQDFRFALRALRRSPGFTVAAIITLALAIGANAVVFGVMNGLVLRPLNVPQPETLWGTMNGDNAGWQSYPNYLDLRDRNRSFEDLAAFKWAFADLDTGTDPASAAGFATTGNYFDVLRVKPYLGRVFHSSDERGPNSAPYIVLSHSYWHSHFQDDRGVVGRKVRLNKHPFTIIGVAPPDFQGTLLFIAIDFFMPIVNQEQVDGANLLNARGSDHGVFEIFGHLKPGVTSTQAVADLNAVGAYIEKTYPKDFPHKTSSLAHEGLTSFGGPVRAFVGGLMLLAGLILLAACANLGSLFAAHAADRSREVALRLALGSSRSRILRGLFSEALLISIAGGALGLWGSVILLGQLSRWQPFTAAPMRIPVSPDARLYLVALALALVSGFLFAIVPVRLVLRTDPYQIIKSASAPRFGHRITMRDVLLVVQIAICAVLVTSSLVAFRGLARSLQGNFGFDPKNTILVGTDLAMAGYTGDGVLPMQRRMIEALRTTPGVEKVGLVYNYPPLINLAGTRANVFRNETTDLKQANVAARPYQYDISPGYFEAAATRLLVGRDFNWHDDKNAPAVVVVNQKFARDMFGSTTNALGAHCKLQDGTRIQVVGIVEDGKYQALTEDQQPAIFLPFQQLRSSQGYTSNLLVRSHRDLLQLTPDIRNRLHQLDSGLPVDSQTWNSLLAVVMFPSRAATVSLGVLGVMGAMLSITSIFGMAAYSVSRRLKELGIRMAIGARPKEVLEAALGRALKLLLIGSSAGLLLGILAGRVLAFIVYQATPRDPLVLAGVVLAMASVGVVATWIPAQRALSLDPMKLLREQ